MRLDRPATSTQITHRQRLWLYALALLTILFLVIPCLIVIPMSFSASQSFEFPPRAWSLRWYETFLSSPEWRTATWMSVKVGISTTLLATIAGTAASYSLHKSKIRAHSLTRSVLVLPMTIPMIFIAIGTFFLFAKLGLNNTLVGLVLAHTTLAIPFVMIAVGNGLEGFDFALEKAARSLGASASRAFFTVTLLQIKMSIFSGMLFAFITSFDDVVVALFISSGSASTLSKKMFENMRDQVDPTVAAISSILVTICIFVLVTVQLSSIIKARKSKAPGLMP